MVSSTPFYILLGAYLLLQLITIGVLILNMQHMRRMGCRIPDEFVGAIDRVTMHRTQAYESDNARFSIVIASFDTVLTIIFFGLLLALYDSWIHGLGCSFILEGVVFITLLYCAHAIIEVPFSWYRTFCIESRHGFNTMTMALWRIDRVKTFVISLIMLLLVSTSVFWLMQTYPERWWLLVWFFFMGMSVILFYVSPYVIDPLFNTYTTIQDAVLTDRIISLCERADIHAGRVQQMDASKRSHHSNAYFTGIGRIKRIVLYDTLLEQMTHDEILAVLAHEIGHWKKRHIVKNVMVLHISTLIGLFTAYYLMKDHVLSDFFGIQLMTVAGKFIFMSFLASVIMFPLRPLILAWSRHNECQADRFACKLIGDRKPLITALIKLAKENLTNLYPHPFYVMMHYSHPPIIDRIHAIRRFDQKSSTCHG